MRLSLPAALLAGCTAALLLQPAAGATPSSAPRRHDFAGGGSTTTLPLPAGTGLAPRGTAPFELLGLGWDGPADALAGAVLRVRTRDAATGRWSGWHRLEADAEDGPDHTAHGATAPLWTGRSDGVAVEFRPGPAGAPPGLRLDLVDPGRGAAPAAVRTLPAEPPTAPPAGPAKGQAPRPRIVTRAGWGADESLRDPEFEYTGPVREVFVHHTATATDYACADAPRVVRAIYQYHVKTNGWRDIGYNFLVDRCGTVYEGRAGGVDQPVHGAHTLGFNTDSAGVAALGTYTGDQPSRPLLDSLAALAAWKLGLAARPADGRARLTSSSDASRYPKGSTVDFDAVSGHRDAFDTECPGNALYARLPALRAAAARLQTR
ncbi:N-acetylmuramoyl-L-alanine amidase [Kitasatospora xanthocidica]|uniref:N-acetylmuramoyl-L-alanine amidase n=1 Tax=Kitasatospora xanthocidica TaxID=83382 RepID=A0A372ZVQ5_9ACTN|nr:peptidoglycan recognition protein [Kitasatospora xanthocidica]RGD59939.1 N-acetylmuramoyl-L-alanine amidase [Kitasatospora xanthocidica]